MKLKQYADGVTREIMTDEKHQESIAIMSRYANEKDAKFIINACNNHDDLLRALENLYETFYSCLGGSDPLTASDFKDELREARETIQKAKK